MKNDDKMEMNWNKNSYTKFCSGFNIKEILQKKQEMYRMIGESFLVNRYLLNTFPNSHNVFDGDFQVNVMV